MRESREPPQRVQVRELGEVVGRQDQGGQVGQRVGERGLDAVDPVPRQEERA